MASQANVYASVAGTVGRSDKDQGAVGVFRRPAETGVWEHVISDVNSNTVYVHPTDPNLVLAGTPLAVYRSEDSGETWKRLPDPHMPTRCVMPFGLRVMRMAQHPTKPGTIYAALEVGGVMRTTNGGESWKDCSDDLIRLAKLPHLKSKIASDTSD